MKTPSIIATCFAFFILINSAVTSAQQKNAAEIYHQMQKLNFLGSVLYIAAHPDDENTRLITHMANETKARTAYLSLTRGDGGQNLIGTELREGLGLIRTHELLQARNIDGGEQFFSRANDFGYSKNPKETLRIWDHQKVSEDIVQTIREFQPDIIINRFDHRTPGSTHGHHTSSALLSVELFDKANPATFEYLNKSLPSWQPQRIYLNISYFFFGSKERFQAADKSNYIAFPTGSFYPLLGKSNQEIAALSRSQHKSQGFGAATARGNEIEYLELIKGKPTKNPIDLFEGIDTSWNRINAGHLIPHIENLVKEFSMENPAKSLDQLFIIRNEIKALPNSNWKTYKLNEVENLIINCAGLFVEATSEEPSYTPNSEINLTLEVNPRLSEDFEFISYTICSENKHLVNQKLTKNTTYFWQDNLQLKEARLTQPFWLEAPFNEGGYTVDTVELRNKPLQNSSHYVIFDFQYKSHEFRTKVDIQHKYTDPVKGEVHEPLLIIPSVVAKLNDNVILFPNRNAKKVGVTLIGNESIETGSIKLELPEGWTCVPEVQKFKISKGQEQRVYFDVKPSKNESEGDLLIQISYDNTSFEYAKDREIIAYDHIPKSQIISNTTAKIIYTEIATNNEKIAYIMGAGDNVPQYLSQLGYDITLLKSEEISQQALEKFDAIIVGIRAYNIDQTLGRKQTILLDYLARGNTLIIQYHTLGKLTTSNLGPYPLKISRDRVTDENAEVRILAPDHPIVNTPNKITSKDFKGWVQEIGLYFPNEWDKNYTPILSANDPGENPKNGLLLVAQHGEGQYIYTGLSFFRELSAGVPGAYRLFANMISFNKSSKNGKKK